MLTTSLQPGEAGMKVHHLNCGTMKAALPLWSAHVLLIETLQRAGPRRQWRRPLHTAPIRRRVGPTRRTLKASLSQAAFAVHQIERLRPAREYDVRHTIEIHQEDLDHAGADSRDFPAAQVHVT